MQDLVNQSSSLTMSNIQKFKFDTRSINVTTDEHGEPWFSAKEVCEVLGYGNHRQAVDTHVDLDDVQKLDAIDAMGRKQQANHINESGLYALIFGSTKEEAKRFKRWVTSEVLPTIRKTGSYSVAGKPKFDLNNPDHLRFALLEYTNKVIELSAANRLIAEQRDHAIETKAHISDKKTATAMATASAAVRENTALKKALSSGASFSGKQYSEVVSAIKYMLSAKGESEPSVLARYGAWEASLWLCAPSTVMAIHRDLINSILAEREPF